MTKWMLLPCLLLATVLAAQTNSSNSLTEANLPAASPQTNAAAPAVQVPALQSNGSVPAGTVVMVRLETTLATFSNRVGDPFRGSVTQPIIVNGQTIIPVGATVEGRVTKVSEPRRFILELADELKAAGQTVNTLRLGEHVVAKTVCRHAVKANDPLAGPELENLVEDLRHCAMPYTCPHGRPTLIEMNYRELEKKFGRAQ